MPSADAVMARAAGENFPVASRLLPRAQREHLLAVYGFARLVDDLGDEAPGDRGALLDWLAGELGRVYAPAGGGPTHPIMRRLEVTVRACRLDREPFERLIAANRRDQEVAEYETYTDLLAYCELSANPVGRLVLGVFGAATGERVRRSDAVCSALQLTEHWQDVAEDLGRGRIYLPAEDRRRFGVSRAQLAAPAAGLELRALMAFEVARARALLDSGEPLAAMLRGRPALAVAAFVAGGRCALDAIARADHDVLGARPRPSRAARGWALARALARRTGR